MKEYPFVLERVEACRKFRLEQGVAADTIALASTPTLFRETRNPDSYLVIPSVSSERRAYIPIAIENGDTIATNLCLVIENANIWHFAVLSSRMHMAWVRLVAGRLKSDYRYSAKLVYNNYPWPENPTDKQKANVEAKAQAVLDARAKYPDSSLADLYDPLTMPPELVKAHEQLDKAVEQCYRSKPFESDRERVEYLFQLYEQLTAPLTAQADKPKRTRKKKTDDGE
jgi:hypothetical protein